MVIEPDLVADLAADIRAVDGNHDLGAAALAAALTARGWFRHIPEVREEGRREALATLPCPACGHGGPHHSSGGMCDGGGTECYCVRFNDPEAWGVDWAARLAPQGRDTGEAGHGN